MVVFVGMVEVATLVTAFLRFYQVIVSQRLLLMKTDFHCERIGIHSGDSLGKNVVYTHVVTCAIHI